MESIIYVGNKAPIKYATAIVTEFEKGPDEVMVKARGRSISTAVDACQISMNKFMEGLEIKDIRIFTEELEDRNVSAIEIILNRPAASD
jgi:DNA-binding protein